MMLLLPPPDTLNPVVDVALDSNRNVWAGIYVDYLSERWWLGGLGWLLLGPITTMLRGR